MDSIDAFAGRRPIRAVAVFCGSRPGAGQAPRLAAAALGQGLAQAGIGLIYGGGHIGLMGVLADAVLDAGGAVRGVIPAFLSAREVAHPGVADLLVTQTMHERKRAMFDAADAFVTLPGGLGTLDETIEIITWKQLGLHAKPVLICDIDGSARGLLSAFRVAVEDGFAGPETAALFEVAADVPALLARLAGLRAPPPAAIGGA